MRDAYRHIIELLSRACSPRTFAIIGECHVGKTSALKDIYSMCVHHDLDVFGFLETAIFENGIRIGYDFLDLQSGETCAVARRAMRHEFKTDAECSGLAGYQFFDEAWLWAESRITQSEQHNILIIDELGRLEGRNLGLMPSLCTSLHHNPRHMIAAVRSDALHDIERHIGQFDDVLGVD